MLDFNLVAARPLGQKQERGAIAAASAPVGTPGSAVSRMACAWF